MSASQVQAQREAQRVANMSDSQVQAQREARQVANMSDSQVQAQREARRVANMSDNSQVQAQREARQVANMSDSKVQARREAQRVANMSDSQVQAQREARQVAHMSDSKVQARREAQRVANMSDSQVQAQREARQVANMSDSQVQARREAQRVANMSDSQVQARREAHRVENMSDSQVQARREAHRVENMSDRQVQASRAQGKDRIRAAVNAYEGYYGNCDETEFATGLNTTGVDADENATDMDHVSDAEKTLREKKDIINYTKFMDQGSDLMLCFVCHEEHSGRVMTKKVYDVKDVLFKPLQRTPDSSPVFAFSEELARRADIPCRVCNRCLADLRKGRVPARSVKNFPIIDDERIMQFFRGLDRIQARLISKVCD
jgi:hypothetical protein